MLSKRDRHLSEAQQTALALFGLEVSAEHYYIWEKVNDIKSSKLKIIASYDFDYWNIRDPNYMFILGILNDPDSSTDSSA